MGQSCAGCRKIYKTFRWDPAGVQRDHWTMKSLALSSHHNDFHLPSSSFLNSVENSRLVPGWMSAELNLHLLNVFFTHFIWINDTLICCIFLCAASLTSVVDFKDTTKGQNMLSHIPIIQLFNKVCLVDYVIQCPKCIQHHFLYSVIVLLTYLFTSTRSNQIPFHPPSLVNDHFYMQTRIQMSCWISGFPNA